jgi:hypothetical protein
MSPRRLCRSGRPPRVRAKQHTGGGQAAARPNPGASLGTYILYVFDDRYTVPTLDGVIVRDDERAIEVANRRLAASPHYHAVEMWEDDRLVCRIDRPDQAASAG